MHQTLSESSFSFCWQALPQVSRSFALSIRLLPTGLKDAVMVSYLLFRMSDTLEDSFLSPKKKRALLHILQTSLHKTEPSERLSKIFVAGLGKHDFGRETFLLHHTSDVFTMYCSLPTPVRTMIST